MFTDWFDREVELVKQAFSQSQHDQLNFNEGKVFSTTLAQNLTMNNNNKKSRRALVFSIHKKNLKHLTRFRCRTVSGWWGWFVAFSSIHLSAIPGRAIRVQAEIESTHKSSTFCQGRQFPLYGILALSLMRVISLGF